MRGHRGRGSMKLPDLALGPPPPRFSMAPILKLKEGRGRAEHGWRGCPTGHAGPCRQALQ